MTGKAFFIMAMAGLIFFPVASPGQSDIKALHKAIIDYRSKMLASAPWVESDLPQRQEEFLSRQQADGSWTDIDYACTSFVGDWKPWEHLFRLEAMAAATQNPASKHYHSAPMIAGVLKGLDYWFARKPVCLDNEWTMGIGRNIPMKSIVVLMADHLTEEQKSQALDQLYYWVKDTDGDGVYEYFYPEIGLPATGQNKLWVADAHLHGAILKNAPQEVADAAAAIRSEGEFSPAEGLNADSSFLQHRPQLYTGGYGMNFASDMARNLRLFNGLSYAFDEAGTERIRNYLLDGVQWMVRRGSWDPLVLGRSISRKDATKVPSVIKTAVEDLRAADPASTARCQSFIDHLAGQNDSSQIGNRHFWRADYHAHRRGNYSFHLRMSSDRTAVCETGSEENTQNSYQSQGATILMMNGDEYANIFPCWRYDQIPGVTAPERNPAPRTRIWGGVQGTQSFVGGVSNGLYGVAAKDLDWDGVTARKSWFCFDDDIVCLGAGISRTGGLPVRTTLNQTIKKSDVFVEYGTGSGTAEALTSGKTLTNPKWIYEGGVGYVIPQPACLTLKNETGVTGDWFAINKKAYTEPLLETKDRFTLMFEHGVDPENASYSYILLPGETREFVQNYANAPQSRVIANTPHVQAVRNDAKKITGIVFWSSGREVQITPELRIAADDSCLVLVDESGPKPKVSVSRYNQTTVLITWDDAKRGEQTLTFSLPGGQQAGTTVTQEIAGSETTAFMPARGL